MHTFLLLLLLCLSCWLSLCVGTHNDIKVVYGWEDPTRNIVKNSDFEDDFNPDGSDWTNSTEVAFSSDAHRGERSLRLYDHTSNRWLGLTQYFTGIKADKIYYLSMYIKATQNPVSTTYYNIKIYASYRDPDNNLVRHPVCRFPSVRKSDNWRQLGGDFSQRHDTDRMKFEIEVSDHAIEFLLDTVSLIELNDWDKDWKKKADAEIDIHRRNMITLNMLVPNSIQLPYCLMELRLKQTKLHFGIGTAIRADPFNEQTTFGSRYRNFVKNTFEWAVFENAMKWKPMESKQGVRKFERVDTAIEFLSKYNITVRGHSVLWALKESNPTWVQDKTGSLLWRKIDTRIVYVIDHYKGTVVDWDIVNEPLHGKFYALAVDDPEFIDKVHNKVRARDANAGLYINDYQLLRTGDYTSAMVDMVRELKSKGVPVDGIGAQSHLRSVPVSPTTLQKRIEILTNAGVPVTMTELSVHHTNVAMRAWQLDVFYRLCFANPNVNAIVHWGFSDQATIGFEPAETALFTTNKFQPNAAGEALLALIKAWRTNKVIKVKKPKFKENIRAYHGAYELSVYYNQSYIKNVTFYLHPGQDISVDIPLTWAEISPVYDGSTKRCDLSGTVDGDDDDDDNNTRNKGQGYAKVSSARKKTKATLQNYIRGSNVATG